MSHQSKEDERFHLLSGVFLAFAGHQRSKELFLVDRAEPVMAEWAEVLRSERERNQRESHFYNPLAAISIRETDHSRILGSLLDPQGDHGQGRLFLDSFLRRIGMKESDQDSWRVTIEGGRVDLVIQSVNPERPSVVIVENKVNDAVDQSNQLYRYWHQEIHLPYPGLDYSSPATRDRFKMIYLPPVAVSGPSRQSLQRPTNLECPYEELPLPVESIGFSPDLIGWLRNQITELPEENIRLRTFLSFYAELWSHPL